MALKSLKGIKTIQQIAKEFDVHPVPVSDWKKTMTEGPIGIFDFTKEFKNRSMGLLGTTMNRF